MIRLFLFISLLLILNSCIEGEEEVRIYGDGSGRLVAHYELPAAATAAMGPPAAYRRELQRIDNEEESLRIKELQFGFVKGKLIIHLDAEFDDALDLLAMSERQGKKFSEETGMPPSELETFLGGIDVSLENLRASYRRQMNIGPFFPEIVRNNPGMLDDSNFRYIVHLPVATETSNAHIIRNGGKTLEWKFLLREHIEEPIVMSFVSESVIPWWACIMIALAIILILTLIWWLIRRLRG